MRRRNNSSNRWIRQNGRLLPTTTPATTRCILPAHPRPEVKRRRSRRYRRGLLHHHLKWKEKERCGSSRIRSFLPFLPSRPKPTVIILPSIPSLTSPPLLTTPMAQLLALHPSKHLTLPIPLLMEISTNLLELILLPAPLPIPWD